jgi:hypothetical protein
MRLWTDFVFRLVADEIENWTLVKNHDNECSILYNDEFGTHPRREEVKSH